MTPVANDSLNLSDVAVLRKEDTTAPTDRQGRILQMFRNVNMGKGHRGLKLIAHEYGISLDELRPGQYVGFLNRTCTKLKLFTAGNTFAYTQLGDGEQFDMEVVRQIPALFQSKAEIACLPAIEESFKNHPGALSSRKALPKGKRLAGEDDES